MKKERKEERKNERKKESKQERKKKERKDRLGRYTWTLARRKETNTKAFCSLGRLGRVLHWTLARLIIMKI